jgi:hypothetical protein
MKLLQQHWQEYKDSVYPGEIPAVQNRECHQAFFAGALAGMSEMKAISELPEEEALAAITKLVHEAGQVCKIHAWPMQFRN